MARTKTNTQNDTKTRTTPWRNRQLEKTIFVFLRQRKVGLFDITFSVLTEILRCIDFTNLNSGEQIGTLETEGYTIVHGCSPNTSTRQVSQKSASWVEETAHISWRRTHGSFSSYIHLCFFIYTIFLIKKKMLWCRCRLYCLYLSQVFLFLSTFNKNNLDQKSVKIALSVSYTCKMMSVLSHFWQFTFPCMSVLQ